MRNKALIVIAGIMLLSGCSMARAEAPEKDVNAAETLCSAPRYDEAAEEIEGTVDAPDIQPPDAFISGIRLDKGNYNWKTAKGVSSRTASTPVVLYELGRIGCAVNINSAGGELTVETEGGEIISAKCYMDDTDSKPCTISGNTVSLSDKTAYNVYSVLVDYPEGECEYLFYTTDSRNNESPPMLRVMAGDLCYKMSLINYQWETESCEVIACGDTAYSNYENGNVPIVPLEGVTKVHISLPDGAKITSAVCYASDGEYEYLPVDGGTIDIPEEPCGKAYGLNIEFANGRGEYVFGSTGDIR